MYMHTYVYIYISLLKAIHPQSSTLELEESSDHNKYQCLA